jgi:hypothetical protein
MGELLDKGYGPVVATEPSDRDATVDYDIRQKADGSLSCSCPNFQFRFTCKHLQRYRARLAAEGRG